MFLTKQFIGRTIALCEFRWEETARLEFGQRADLPISGASAFRARFGATRKEARRAYKAAVAAQRDYDDAMAREQEKLVRSISKLPTAERPLTILLAAHPYVSHDPFVAVWWKGTLQMPASRLSPGRSLGCARSSSRS